MIWIRYGYWTSNSKWDMRFRSGHRIQNGIFGSKPGPMWDPGLLEPGTGTQDPGPGNQGPEDLGPGPGDPDLWTQDPGTWGPRTRDPGPGTRDPGSVTLHGPGDSGTRDPGTRDPGLGTRGSGPRTFESLQYLGSASRVKCVHPRMQKSRGKITLVSLYLSLSLSLYIYIYMPRLVRRLRGGGTDIELASD